MSKDNIGFKTAIFRGFNREDVLRYIEQSASESATIRDALQYQLSEAQTALQTLQKEHAELSGEHAKLLEQLGQMTIDSDKAKAETQKLQNDLAETQNALEQEWNKQDEQKRQVEEAKATYQKLELTNKEMQAKMASLQQECDDYHEAKDKLAEIELSAYRRAKEVDNQAQEEAKAVRYQANELIRKLRIQLSDIGGQYRNILSNVKTEAADTTTRADTLLQRMEKLSQSLDSAMLAQVVSGDQNVLASVRSIEKQRVLQEPESDQKAKSENTQQLVKALADSRGAKEDSRGAKEQKQTDKKNDPKKEDKGGAV